MVKVLEDYSAHSISKAGDLFREYADSLGIDLDFQNFDEELKSLPGDYAPPNGCLLFAMIENQYAGCVALRKLDHEICEMKRLYIKREFRHHGGGKILAREIIARARKLGYRKMRLDTLPSMESARSLYISLGFYEIPPYRFNPVPGTLFMELDLASFSSGT